MGCTSAMSEENAEHYSKHPVVRMQFKKLNINLKHFEKGTFIIDFVESLV